MSMLIDTDVLVVGGGVAGATTARLLAETGHHVILLDRARFPRDKPCGEGVMPTGVRLLDRLGVLAKIPPERRHILRGVGFVVNGRDSVCGDFPDIGEGFNRGLGVKRLVLDHQVLEHARSHPAVEVRESEPAIDARWPAGGLAEVSTPRARYRARVVVGADGVRSLIRRKLGLELPHGRRRRYGIRAHFTFREERHLPDYVMVYGDRGAESYTTPVSATELEVALLVERSRMKSFAGRLEPAYDAYLQSLPHLWAVVQGGQRSSEVLACGPFDVWARSRVSDRAILVGDAGGYLDPITGEGISLALQGAYWAAEVVDDALRRDDLSAARLRPYHTRLEQALGHYKILTRAVLSLVRHERLAGLLVRRLACCPELYSSLLAVNCGVRTFWDLSLAELLGFVFGRCQLPPGDS
jgi:flavin-dependent dehydrogenase